MENTPQSEQPNSIPNIRRILFWDTDFDKIDWTKHKRYVIDRVVERGTPEEREEVAEFYDIDKNDLHKYRFNNQYRINYLHNKPPEEY